MLCIFVPVPGGAVEQADGYVPPLSCKQEAEQSTPPDRTKVAPSFLRRLSRAASKLTDMSAAVLLTAGTPTVHAPVGISQPLHASTDVAGCCADRIDSAIAPLVPRNSVEPLIVDVGHEATLAMDDSRDLCFVEEMVLE